MTSETIRFGFLLHDAVLVAALLAAGADPAARSRVGWTVLHEAVAAGDRDVVRLVVDALNAKYTASYVLKAVRVVAVLQQTCVFVAHVSWKLVSWMSLVGWVLPSDTTTIAKHWNAFRSYTSVVWISSVQPVYQRATVLLLGSKRLAPLSLTRRRQEDVLHQHDARTVQRLRMALNSV